MSEFKVDSQLIGRNRILTSKKITGNPIEDIQTVKKILEEALPVHNKNVNEENKLFDIYFNGAEWWAKSKTQRSDINNKISIPTAWSITRTLNGYCFTEPIKYVARSQGDNPNAQEQVEKLSAMLDFTNNHASTIMASLCSSVCGLGYKLVLPSTDEEYEDTNVPFVINQNVIYPQTAFVVYSNEAISREVLGVLLGTYVNDEGDKYNQYTCWTKYHQFVYRDGGKEEPPYVVVKQYDAEGNAYDWWALQNRRIPLIEVARNPFRKGDWEVATDLLVYKNMLMSSRADDIQQIIDYVMVLMNCQFETTGERDDILKSRVIELQVTDPLNKPSVDILKNPLDQNAVQTCAEYIDRLIQECVGVPSRQEKGFGGGDTGSAVQYRNGFRDLENNAGLIIPEMDKAETKFLAVCIGYCRNMINNEIGDLKPYNVRCKYNRSLTDDMVSSSQAFLNYINGGLDYEDALILSKSGTDPSEISRKAKIAFENEETLMQRQANSTKVEENTQPDVVDETKKVETNPNE